eukprot:TRINITY_DN2845_c0_g2_i1.p1 TRINITY_DN2845_c0_g2~~TRINITY_DN2845_c0_g2_i1.p1  ORF type:complete len:791 (+),score=104.72 TRINITY_DN2845_c0_g2_i1:91-2463(+)
MGGAISSSLFHSKVGPKPIPHTRPTEPPHSPARVDLDLDPDTSANANANPSTDLDLNAASSPVTEASAAAERQDRVSEIHSPKSVASSPIPIPGTQHGSTLATNTDSDRVIRAPSTVHSEPPLSIPYSSSPGLTVPGSPAGNGKKPSVSLSDSPMNRNTRSLSQGGSNSKRSFSVNMMSPPNTPSKSRFSFSFRAPKVGIADFADQVSNRVLDMIVEDGSYSTSEFPKYITQEIGMRIKSPVPCGDVFGVSFYDLRLGDKICIMTVHGLTIPELAPLVNCICLRNNCLTSGVLHQLYQSLSPFTSLAKLDLSCNPLGDEGLKQLLELFPNIPTLNSLNLSSIGITDSVVDILVEYISKSTTLTELRLVSNLFTEDGVNRILAALQQNKTLLVLDLEGSPGYSSKNHKKYEGIIREGRPSRPKTCCIDWECHPAKYTISTGTVILPDGTLVVSTHTSAIVTKDICIVKNEDWTRVPLYTQTDSVFVTENGTSRSFSFISYTNEVVEALGEISLKNNGLKTGRFLVGYSETMGRRMNMEDRIVVIDNFMDQGWHFTGLFDGHGGVDAAIFAAEQVPQMIQILYAREGYDADPAKILHQAFLDVNEAMCGYLFCGTTALVSLIINDDLYVACAGDSRAVLSRGGEVIRLSKDHKPTEASEKARICSVGGFVKDGRVNGVLSVARSLGDSFLHPVVSSEPYLTVTRLKLPGKSMPEPEGSGGHSGMAVYDDFLLLGCDGVWDVLSDYEAATIARFANFQQRPDLSAESVRNSAFRLGSADNISVIVISFASGNL